MQFIMRLFTRVCPLFGFLLNFLLIWLILAKTPKEMVAHSRILLQTCFFDIFFLLQQIIGTPILARLDDVLIDVFYGYFADNFYNIFDPFGLAILTCISSVLFGFDLMLIVFQFVYRYFLLNRNTQIGLTRYFQMLFFPILLYILLVAIFLVNIRENILKCRSEDDEYLIKMNMLEKACFLIVDKKLILSFQYFWSWAILCVALSFSIIIFLRWRIIRFVNAHSMVFSENTRRLNKQLTRTLTLLAVYPFVSLCLMLLMGIFLFLFGMGANSDWAFRQLQFGSIIVYITPMVNPYITILINTPYRGAIRRILFWWRKSQQQIMPN